MPETTVQPSPTTPLNGVVAFALEARLRYFFSEQARLRELLERARADLDRVNAELLRFQDEYCTDAVREGEYDRAIERILGFNPRIDPKEIEEAMANPQGIEDILEELERHAEGEPDRSRGASPAST
jgi:hypothetical protein